MRRPRTPVMATALALAATAGLTLVLAPPGAASASSPPRADPPALRTTAVATTVRHRPSKVIMPVRRARGVATGTRTARISYHGGRVMTGTVHLYVVWYGAWSGRAAVPLLTDLLRGFGSSPYAGTNATYTDARKRPASTDVRYVRSMTDDYSQGRSLSDAGVRQVVLGALKAGALPADSSGIYLVLTSADVKETSGFGSKYCGWHTRTTFQRKAIRYVFAGDPTTQAPRGCVPPVTTTPNGDRAADALASTVVHEIDETLTDPDLDAWYDRWFSENADKCAWTYGYTYRAANGGTANVRLGGHDFLVQQNWVAGAKQGCALS